MRRTLLATLIALGCAAALAQTGQETETPAAEGTPAATGTAEETPAATGGATDATSEGTAAGTETATEAPDPETTRAGLAAWEQIHQVLAHPRCVNCHVPEDNLPRWSGPSYGKARVHGMHISGGESRIGAETLPCATCHGEQNADVPHGPPGAPHWQLAPVEQVWWGRSSAEICAQIQDPERNGGRTLADIATHVAEDELVHWGWAPGPGREPAPFSADETAEMIRAWDAAGAPCPD